MIDNDSEKRPYMLDYLLAKRRASANLISTVLYRYYGATADANKTHEKVIELFAPKWPETPSTHEQSKSEKHGSELRPSGVMS